VWGLRGSSSARGFRAPREQFAVIILIVIIIIFIIVVCLGFFIIIIFRVCLLLFVVNKAQRIPFGSAANWAYLMLGFVSYLD